VKATNRSIFADPHRDSILVKRPPQRIMAVLYMTWPCKTMFSCSKERHLLCELLRRYVVHRYAIFRVCCSLHFSPFFFFRKHGMLCTLTDIPSFPSSSPSNPVYARPVDFSDFVFSLSSYRHSYIGLVCNSLFLDVSPVNPHKCTVREVVLNRDHPDGIRLSHMTRETGTRELRRVMRMCLDTNTLLCT
jgi:hypothetical protein